MKRYALPAIVLLLTPLAGAQNLDVSRTLTSTGVVIPNREVILAAKIVGRVETVNPRGG